MTVWMDKTANGRDCLRNDASGRTKALPADCILVRMSDGAVTIAEPEKLPCLSPAQAEMVKYFLAEKGMAEPDVFAGQPEREAPRKELTRRSDEFTAKKTDATNEKENAI